MNKDIIINYILPSCQEHSDLAEKFPYQNILNPIACFIEKPIEMHSFNRDSFNIAKTESYYISWLENVETLVHDINYTYGFFQFFYQSGIPDERVSISLGENGESIQYFPDFKSQHWYNQRNFRYFAEILISKIFSILDNYGTILYALYSQQIPPSDKKKYIYFETPINEFVNKEENKNDQRLIKLKIIIDSSNYRKVKKIRNDILHNKTPLKLSTSLAFTDTEKQRMLRPSVHYIKAKEVNRIVDDLIHKILLQSTNIIFKEDS
jgi:hypothetical protein